MCEKKRCPWPGKDQLYLLYHDTEWGVPVHDDMKMFEFLLLETFQAGLSWLTILKKRENFRIAFNDFYYERSAQYGEEMIAELMNDAGIIRNMLKIRAAVSNAQAYIRVREEYGTFCRYLWSFTGNKQIMNNYSSLSELPAKTELSDRISKDLRNRGFKFTGSTVIYAHLQATGLVNDHLVSCFRYKEVQL
ncbi:MAG: DNA-3-methyladenine glycosylase I [Bacteroidota bacterium]